MEDRIALSKTRLILFLVFCCAMVGAGVYFMFFAPAQDAGASMFGKWFFTILGVLCVLLFAALSFFFVRKIFDPQPGLIVNSEGLTDNSTGVSVGFIPWSDIRGIKDLKVQSLTMIAVYVHDPEAYILKGSKFQRSQKRGHMKTCGTPIKIYAGTLKISHKSLGDSLAKHTVWLGS